LVFLPFNKRDFRVFAKFSLILGLFTWHRHFSSV
jgi:hypothetical protein